MDEAKTPLWCAGAFFALFALACASAATSSSPVEGGIDAGPDAQSFDAAADNSVFASDAESERAPGVDGPSDDGASDAPPSHGYALPTFAGGYEFYLRLPPAFSPFLPLYGDEVTREPPGFHDVTADAYFSYEFLWWLTDTPDLSTSALRSDLLNYFRGLCSSPDATVTLDDPAVDGGAGDERNDSGADAQTNGALLLSRQYGTLDATTCFSAAVPPASIEVSIYQCPDHVAVIVLVSPKDPMSAVWTELQRVRDGFTCF